MLKPFNNYTFLYLNYVTFEAAKTNSTTEIIINFQAPIKKCFLLFYFLSFWLYAKIEYVTTFQTFEVLIAN